MKITAKSDSEDIRIYINGILHLRIPRDKNMMIQSWVEGHTKRWIIQFTVKKQQDYVAYDNRGMWKKMLKILDKSI